MLLPTSSPWARVVPGFRYELFPSRCSCGRPGRRRDPRLRRQWRPRRGRVAQRRGADHDPEERRPGQPLRDPRRARGRGPNYLRAADFNADGRTDLVTSNAGVDAITVLMAVPGDHPPHLPGRCAPHGVADPGPQPRRPRRHPGGLARRRRLPRAPRRRQGRLPVQLPFRGRIAPPPRRLPTCAAWGCRTCSWRAC